MSEQRRMIFTATALTPGKPTRWRTWGWWDTFEEADGYVMKGDPLFFEDGTYTHAVIEKVTSGFLPYCDERWWYRAEIPAGGVSHENPAPLKVERIDTPESEAHVVNYAMG
jgi:hypothetical protein